jgi:hypothetical protein
LPLFPETIFADLKDKKISSYVLLFFLWIFRKKKKKEGLQAGVWGQLPATAAGCWPAP